MNDMSDTEFVSRLCTDGTVSQDKPGSSTRTGSTRTGSTKTDRFRVFKSVCLVVTWICMGLYNGITGPTLPDLGERLNTEYGSLGFAIAFRSIGKMTGSPTYGYLRDRFSSKGDLILGVALIVVALSVVTKPWVTTVGMLTFLFFVEGFSHGGINAVGNSMCVQMWKDKAAMPIHFLHFGYGVGALLSPLIARPFLSLHETINLASNVSSATTSVSTARWVNVTADEDSIVTIRQSQIEVPYAIVSGFVIMVGFMYVGLFLYKPFRRMTAMFGSEPYSSLCQAPFLKDCPKTAVAILAVYFFYYMVTTVTDKSLTSFLFTYAVESNIGFSKSEAAYLNTAFFACYAAGRVVIGLVALKLSIKYILFLEVYLSAACSAVITFYAFDKRVFLWVFACSLAFCFGPIYPSGVAWVDRYVPVYGLVVAIFDIGNGIGSFTANWMSGHLISRYGPRALLYFTFSASAVVCVLIVIGQKVGGIRGDRHEAIKRQITLETDGNFTGNDLPEIAQVKKQRSVAV